MVKHKAEICISNGIIQDFIVGQHIGWLLLKLLNRNIEGMYHRA